MLSGLLKSDIAVKVNIQIINAFVYMRKYISKDLGKECSRLQFATLKRKD